MKGISPLIASVLLIAFTIAIAGVISGWMSGLTKTTTEAAGRGAKCPGAGLEIISTSCSSNIVKITTMNSGSVDLTNFVALVTDQAGTTTTNNTQYTGTLSPGSSVQLFVTVPNAGRISRARVSAGSCPGTYGEQTNASGVTTDIASC